MLTRSPLLRVVASLVIAAAAGCSSSLVAYDAENKDAAPSDGAVDTETTEVDSTVPTDTGTTTTGDVVDAKRPNLDAIEPWYGTVGQIVTITGGPFEDPVEVTIGDLDAHVVQVNEDAVDVEVPDLGDDLTGATVEVTSADRKGKNALTFDYFQDGTGLVGAVGTIEWNDLRGNYWTADSVDGGYAQVLFPIPTAYTWQTFIYSPFVEHCELNYVAPTLYVYAPGVSSVEVTAGAVSHTLVPDPKAPFLYSQVDLPVAVGQAYDLDPMVGGVDWPDFSLTDLSGVIPNGLVITYPSIDGADPPTVPRQFTVQWNGPYDGDGVLLYMERQRFDGTSWISQEHVSCWVQDDGTFALPNLWTDWQSDDGVLFYAGRYNEPSNVLLPYNNARSAVLGTYWTVGFLIAN